MLTLKVAGFGPIHDGLIQLKPLTVFVGPNNAGKSYLAMLVYAIHHAATSPYPRALAGRMYLRHRQFYQWPLFGFADTDISEATRSAWRSWLVPDALARRQEREVLVETLPDAVRQFINTSLERSVTAYGSLLGGELIRCFGTDLADLIAPARSRPSFHLTLSNSSPRWTIDVHCTKRRIVSKLTDISLEQMSIRLRDVPPARMFRVSNEHSDGLVDESLLELVADIHLQIFHAVLRDSYYLPAARSGILQSHKALAHILISQASRIGIERVNVPQLSGVVTDFIANIMTLDQKRVRSLTGLSKLLDNDVIGGDIEFEAGKVEYPEIYYRSSEGRYPLSRSSSMISELAPISLFMKHLVERGDLFIIEEPESHLHPETQRKLARVIARMIRAQVNMVITTHSDYFLSQINNFLRLGQLDADGRVEAGYTNDDFLRPHEVAPYLFEPSRADEGKQNGTSVKEVAVSQEDGISENEFARVSEALYDETVRLERKTSIDGGDSQNGHDSEMASAKR